MTVTVNLCLAIIGFIIGISVTQIFEFSNTNISISSISNINEQATSSINTILNAITKPEHKEINLLSDELLYGLSKGLNPYPKVSEPNNSKPKQKQKQKQIRMVYIVGNEGTGHHLWENIMKEMAKHSDKISADYIENEVLLVKLMHSCFIEIHYKQKKMHQIMESKEGEYYKQALANSKTKENKFVSYACNAFEIELKKVYNTLSDNSLIYMRSYSYPYFGISWDQIPSVPFLVHLADKIGFDVKLIVMKRDWINTFVSSCIHRYGQCKQRIMFTNPIISLIQSHLFSLDNKYWIMIDYEDFMLRPIEYVDIVNKWLKINDKQFVKNMFKQVIKPSKVSVSGSGWNDMKKKDKKSAQLIKKLYYEQYSKHFWPIYDSNFFTVTPENYSFAIK